MAFSDEVKGASVRSYTLAVERRPVAGGGYERVEHIFVNFISGAVVDIQPQKGVVKTIAQLKRDNSYPYIGYAWGNNKFYVATGLEAGGHSAVFEYDPVLQEVTEAFDALNFLPYYSSDYQGAFLRGGGWSGNGIPSTDGHLYGAAFQYLGMPAIFRIANSVVDIYNQLPDVAAEIVQGINLSTGFNFTGSPAALQGVYAWYLYDNNFVHLFSTIISEATSAGVTFENDSTLFQLHTDDRAVGSTTRRVKATCNISGVDSPGVYVARLVDLKDVSDRTPDLVGGSNAAMSTLTGITGISDPAFSIGLVYTESSRQVGRFMYASNYMGDTSHFYGMPYALDDYPGLDIVAGQMIFPLNQSWDRATALPNFAGSFAGVYKCNFASAMGFSSSDEYVMFFYSHSDGTTKGFLRPDNLEFQAYDPVADPSGYVVAAIGTAAEFIEEFDCYQSVIFSTSEVNGNTVATDTFLTSAVLEEFATVADADGYDVAELTFEFLPDKNYHIVKTGTAKGVPIVASNVAGVVELDTNQLIIAGLLYAGIYVKTRSGASLADVAFYNNINSIYNSFRFDATTAIFLGYSDEISVVRNTPSFAAYPVNARYSLYGCKFNATTAIVTGMSVRVPEYYENYAYAFYINPTTGATADLPDRPNVINPFSGKIFREALGLTNATYSDNAAMAAAISYAAANSLTLTQVINLALDTCLYYALEPVSWDTDKCLISLYRNGVSGLMGIRLNTQADQSGTWYDEDYGAATAWPTCVYFDNSDPSSLVEADYKLIELQIAGTQGMPTIGRLAISDNYVAFMHTDNAGGSAEIRIIAKTDIEAAAAGSQVINSLHATAVISLNSTSTGYGFGPSEDGYGIYSKYDKAKSFFFTEGDNLYCSIITNTTSGGSKPAIYQINLATAAITIWARLNNDSTKTLNYNPDTDTCFVSVGTAFYAIDNFTGITAPYDIT